MLDEAGLTIESTGSACKDEDSHATSAKAQKKAKHRKVRTGCITCKIRKVKCGEERPGCLRCTSTGRKCDGYSPSLSPRSEQPPKRLQPCTSNRKPTSLVPIRSSWVASGEDGQVFDYLRSRTIPMLSGFLDEHFWSRFVLQIGETEPSIRHALLAVASNHNRIERLDPLTNKPKTDLEERLITPTSYILHNYNAAIRHLREHLISENNQKPLILLACIIFICLEFLRGNFDTAVTQIHSGFAILTAANEDLESMGTWPAHVVDHELAPMFGRLGILSSLFGKPPPQSGNPATLRSSPVSEFHDLREARTELVGVVSRAIRFIQMAADRFARPTDELMSDILSGQMKLKSKLTEWSAKFQRYQENVCLGKVARPNPRAVAMLGMEAKITGVWVNVAAEFDETSFDAYNDDFASILRNAEVATAPGPDSQGERMAGTASHPPRFAFDLGMIPPLYYVASKCRHPWMRRHAVWLLYHRVPRYEGLWSAMEAAAVGVRIIQIEEAGCGYPSSSPADILRPSQDWSAKSLSQGDGDFQPLPESSRLRDAQIDATTRVAGKGKESKGRYVTFVWSSCGEERATWRRECVRDLDLGELMSGSEGSSVVMDEGVVETGSTDQFLPGGLWPYPAR